MTCSFIGLFCVAILEMLNPVLLHWSRFFYTTPASIVVTMTHPVNMVSVFCLNKSVFKCLLSSKPLLILPVGEVLFSTVILFCCRRVCYNLCKNCKPRALRVWGTETHCNVSKTLSDNQTPKCCRTISPSLTELPLIYRGVLHSCSVWGTVGTSDDSFSVLYLICISWKLQNSTE